MDVDVDVDVECRMSMLRSGGKKEGSIGEAEQRSKEASVCDHVSD